MLNTRTLTIASAGLGLLALGLIGWQVAKRPAPEATTSASGIVTRGDAPPPSSLPTLPGPSPSPSPATLERPAPADAPALAPVPAPTGSASATHSHPAAALPSPTRSTGATTSASAGASEPAGSAAAAPSAGASRAGTAVAGIVKHRVAPRPTTQPPILPNEVNATVAKALGARKLSRYFYLDPLARRFVATVDGLGQQAAPTSMWLLRPAKGQMQLTDSKRQKEVSLVTTANAQRYTGFVRWIESMDNARLITLYARMYPLLQQTYVEMGHPEGYFNDRLIEVIDQLLATPTVKAPLRVQPINTPPPPGALPQAPRFALVNPQLEQLSTGQKTLLRLGPEQAERLKVKLKALRSGLIKLNRPARN